MACPLRDWLLRDSPGYDEAISSAPLRSGTDQTFTGLVMYFSTHAPNGRVQARCEVQRSNVACKPGLLE